ncbi:hypothetical protein [Enterobacter phage EC151]|nr:hypothetical protein [Enterobacter phage EC151]
MQTNKRKVMAPELTLLQYYPELRGNVGDDGWVAIHNTGFNGQRTSINALNYLHRLGFHFDVQTNDGKIFTDVNINDVHVKLEYNVMSSIETYPENGIHCWRLSSHVGVLPPAPVNNIVDYKTNHFKELAMDAPECMSADEALRQCFSKGPLTQAELYKAGLEPDVGPFYANDKYKREIKPGVFIDVYDVIDCFEVTSGALQHALKKLLATGKRGHKDYEQDLIDILSSVERALFQHQEKVNAEKETGKPS